jgi:integrase
MRLERELREKGVPSKVTLKALFSEHLKSVLVRYGKESFRDKQATFKEVMRRFGGDTYAVSLGYYDLEKYLLEVSRKVSGSRANRKRVHLVRAWTWGVRALGLPEPCPWRVEKFREEKTPRYVPTEEDFMRVYTLADDQEKLALLLAIDCLGRKMEIFGLRWADVDFGQLTRAPHGAVRFWTGKRAGGRAGEWVPMTERALRLMRVQRLKTGLKGRVLIDPRTDRPYTENVAFLRLICQRARVKPFGWHGLRHLGACLLDEGGFSLAHIQGMLRHKMASTTSIYLRDLRGME